VNKKDVDPYAILSLVSELKLNPNLKLLTHETNILDPVGAWLNKPVNTWKLLYKFTRDQKTNEAWHQACNGKGPTVSVVRTKDGHVFGGYCHLSWWTPSSGERSEQKESKESFIFSITDGKNRQPYKLLQYQNYQDAIFSCSNAYGFGWGTDGIDLILGPGMPQHCSSYLNNTYALPEGYTNPSTWLAGSSNYWKIIEIETYLV